MEKMEVIDEVKKFGKVATIDIPPSKVRAVGKNNRYAFYCWSRIHR